MPLRARASVAAAVASFLALASFASTPGSSYQPILPAGATSSGPFRWLGDAVGFGRLEGDPLAFVGAALLLLGVAAFGWLLVEALAGRLPLRVAVGLALAFHLALLFVPLLFSRDVYSYGAYGRIVAIHGANPYVVGPSAFPTDPFVSFVGPKWLGSPSVYGPAFTTLSALIARLVGTVEGTIVVYRAIAIAASLATLGVIVPLARRLAPGRESLAVVAFACDPVILLHSVASGHNDLLVALGIAGGLALVARGRPTLAASLLTLATLIKAPAALPLALSVVAVATAAPRGRRWRAAAPPVSASVAIGSVFALPYMQREDPTLGLAGLATHEGWLAPSRFVRRIADLVPGVPLGGAVRAAFALALMIAVVAIAVALARRLRVVPIERREDLAVHAAELGAAWGWALLALMLLGPVLLPWYVAWSLPIAFLLPRKAWIAVVATSMGLGVSLFATEPDRFPSAFDVNLLIGHWLITPLILGLLVWAGVELSRRFRAGSTLVGDPRDETDHGRDEDRGQSRTALAEPQS